MGVRGLKTLVQYNEFLTEDCDLCDTALIFDASDLAFILSAQSLWSEMICGDLVKLGQYFNGFFENLKQCNIEPILVFNGAAGEISSIKRQSKLDRNLERFEAFQAFNQRKIPENRDHMVSSLAIIIFRSIALDRGIKIVQTAFEADLEAARLANEHNCHIVSNSGDYLLLSGLKGGVIITDSLDHQRPLRAIDPVTKRPTNYYIKCKLFKQSNLLRYLGDLDLRTLPLMDVLAGRNLLDQKLLDDFCWDLPNGELYEVNKHFSSVSKKLVKILHFFAGKTVDEVVDAICRKVPQHFRGDLMERINRTLELSLVPTYDSFSEGIALMIRPGFKATYSHLSPEESDQKFEEVVPALVRWLKQATENSLGTHKVLESVIGNSIFIRPHMDDCSLPSAQSAFKKVINIMVNLAKSSDPDVRCCNIYDRWGRSYAGVKYSKQKFVGDSVSIDYLIYDMPTLSETSRREILLAAFNCSPKYYWSVLPDFFKWFEVKTAKEMLILDMLIVSLEREGQGLTGKFRHAIILCILYCINEDRSLRKDKFGEEETMKLTNFIREIQCERLDCRSGYDFHISHQLTQLQSSIVAYNHLNAFLGDVCPRVKAEKWLNCCLIYNLAKHSETESQLPNLPKTIPFNLVHSSDPLN